LSAVTAKGHNGPLVAVVCALFADGQPAHQNCRALCLTLDARKVDCLSGGVVTFAIDAKANEAVDVIGDEADVPCAAL
jgi:hypothetical protein